MAHRKRIKLTRRFIRLLVWIGLKFIIFFVTLLPLKISSRIGRGLGNLSFILLKRTREIALRNISIVFKDHKSEEEIYKIGRESFKNLGMSLLEVLNLHKVDKKTFVNMVKIVGEQNLKKAYESGNGVILIGGHIGNWELIALSVSMMGYPMSVIAAPIYDQRINNLIVNYRLHHKINTIERGGLSSNKNILSILKKREVLGFLIDHDSKKHSRVLVNFFNRKSYAPSGAASLTLRTGAAVLLASIHRERNQHIVEFHEQIKIIKSDDLKNDIIVNSEIFMGKIEKQIRCFPEEWTWIHKRWS